MQRRQAGVICLLEFRQPVAAHSVLISDVAFTLQQSVYDAPRLNQEAEGDAIYKWKTLVRQIIVFISRQGQVFAGDPFFQPEGAVGQRAAQCVIQALQFGGRVVTQDVLGKRLPHVQEVVMADIAGHAGPAQR